jgi:glutathione S-transferase
MKLFYFKNACSLAVRIILNELEIPCKFVAIKHLQTKEKVLETGEVFLQISPKNQVPALLLENGRILTEVWVILTYLSDLKNATHLQGEEKYKTMEWLSFISTELHKNFVPIISPIVPENTKPIFVKIFISKLKFAEEELKSVDFIAGKSFTLADAYLFTILSWLKFINVEINSFPNLARYFERMKSRPSIAKSLTDEGIN